MPWIDAAHKDDKSYYQVPRLAPANHDCTEINEYRKQCMQSAEHFKKIKHLDAAYFKDESNFWRKCYKGACYAIGWLSANPSGDCIGIEANKEIAPYIDHAFSMVIYPRMNEVM
jgi:hypothetical protein